MNTPASTSTAAMSRAWKMSQPTMLSASKLQRARPATRTPGSGRPAGRRSRSAADPNVSGNVTSAARMQPQNTSWWASQRLRERPADERLATSRCAATSGRAARRALRPRRRPRNASQPRRFSMRRRRPPQPDRVAVDDAEDREDVAEQVADERGVEPDEPVAADERRARPRRATATRPQPHPPPIQRTRCLHGDRPDVSRPHH